MKGLRRAHGRYIARDNAAQDATAASKGFDAETEDIDIPPKLNEWQTHRDERLWRFIVSPEFGEPLDLTKLTRDLMARIESDTGRSLEWVAIAHFNTGHPHVHVALRVRDRAEKEARFERDYIRNGMRADAKYAQARETEQQHVKQAVEPSDDPDRFLFTLPEVTAQSDDSSVAGGPGERPGSNRIGGAGGCADVVGAAGLRVGASSDEARPRPPKDASGSRRSDLG